MTDIKLVTHVENMQSYIKLRFVYIFIQPFLFVLSMLSFRQ